MTTAPERVLMTGAAGSVGTTLRRGLRGHYRELVLLDRAPLEPEAPNERCLEVDLRDFQATCEALRGVDAVIHLGAIPGEAPFEEILEGNIRTTHHVLEGCRRAGVRRLVFASSNHATGFYPRDAVIDGSVYPRPDSFYGVSKVTGEALASLYHDKYGIEAVCVRIGTAAEVPRDRRALSTWLSPSDCVRLFRRCLDAPDVGFVVIYGVSANTRRWWTDDAAATALDYVPQDDAEHYADEIESSALAPADVPSERFQGGGFVD